MPEVVASVDDDRNPRRQHTLWSIVLSLGALGFVTALIAFSESASPAWLLYLVPIIIAALTHDVAGAVVATLLSLGALLLVAPHAAAGDGTPELALGFAVFLICGVVLGVQARRQRGHARLLEEASAVDSETGITKAEHFYARLNEELRRADRYNHTAGLLFVRADGFDDFVRLFGRYKASLMLQHLADVLRLSVRSTDVVGRIDVATFAVILLHADEAGCAAAAARVHAATLEAEYEGDALEPVTGSPTSVACASYPDECSTQQGLIALAHERLRGPAATAAGESS